MIVRGIIVVLAACISSLQAFAQTSAIAVTEAKIEAGALIIRGTTAAPLTSVRLDDRYERQSNDANAFEFRLTNYHPGDCVVDLTAGSAATTAVVANCGPSLHFRGAWQSSDTYIQDDFVVHGGSTWLARQRNTGSIPREDSPDWVIMARRGAKGADGVNGATGPQGAAGPPGARLRGKWASTETYLKNDIVTYEGSSYRAVRNVFDKNPKDSDYWEVFVARGAKGAQGPQGPAGPQGVPGRNAMSVVTATRLVSIRPTNPLPKIVWTNRDTTLWHFLDENINDVYRASINYSPGENFMISGSYKIEMEYDGDVNADFQTAICYSYLGPTGRVVGPLPGSTRFGPAGLNTTTARQGDSRTANIFGSYPGPSLSAGPVSIAPCIRIIRIWVDGQAPSTTPDHITFDYEKYWMLVVSDQQ